MTFNVRGNHRFWSTVDAIQDEKLKSEVYEVGFRLVEDGPAQSEAVRTRVGMEVIVIECWSIELSGGEGYILYLSPEDLGSDYIYCIDLIWYDWATQ